MNNIKKIGLTALAGSLVSLGSAGAGEMSVSGSINTTLVFGEQKLVIQLVERLVRQRRIFLRWR